MAHNLVMNLDENMVERCEWKMYFGTYYKNDVLLL